MTREESRAHIAQLDREREEARTEMMLARQAVNDADERLKRAEMRCKLANIRYEQERVFAVALGHIDPPIPVASGR